MKDGEYGEEELDDSAGLMVEFGLQKSLHFKEELIKYRSYSSEVTSLNEAVYIKSLIDTIQPTNTLALYSYCVELLLANAFISEKEGALLQKIGAALELSSPEMETIDKLMLQRKVIQKDKIC